MSDEYERGYAHGKDKAHFEVRTVVEGPPHHPTCECQPCITIRIVIHETDKRRLQELQEAVERHGLTLVEVKKEES